MFADLQPPPPDPILGMAQLLARDSSSQKVDLGIGVYNDEAGQTVVLPTVKAAERWLLETQATKRYLSSAGNPEFAQAIRELLFSSESTAFERSRTIQTPGGTGAVRVAADFLRHLKPAGRVFIPSPTWANHGAIFKAAGLEVVTYPYYDVASGTLRFDEMMAALDALRDDDTLLLHGCCHNPTGADPNPAQWAAIADLLDRTGATPLVDLAYQGFAEGLEADATSVRLLAKRVPEMLVASSCSKNFALYRERVGALTLVGATENQAVLAQAHLMPIVRANYSMPPDHGAAVVAHILTTPALRSQWELEVGAMRARIRSMRQALAAHLAGRSARDFGYVADQNGMFVLLGVGVDAVERMRVEHHVHMTASGRVNVAGLTPANVERVADAIVAVVNG